MRGLYVDYIITIHNQKSHIAPHFHILIMLIQGDIDETVGIT